MEAKLLKYIALLAYVVFGLFFNGCCPFVSQEKNNALKEFLIYDKENTFIKFNVCTFVKSLEIIVSLNFVCFY